MASTPKHELFMRIHLPSLQLARKISYTFSGIYEIPVGQITGKLPTYTRDVNNIQTLPPALYLCGSLDAHT